MPKRFEGFDEDLTHLRRHLSCPSSLKIGQSCDSPFKKKITECFLSYGIFIPTSMILRELVYLGSILSCLNSRKLGFSVINGLNFQASSDEKYVQNRRKYISELFNQRGPPRKRKAWLRLRRHAPWSRVSNRSFGFQSSN